MARTPHIKAIGVGVRVRGAAETNLNLTQEDAKRYLNQVQRAFANKVGKYATFRELLIDFKNRRIGIHALLFRVKELLQGHNKLIAGFNKFVPENHELKIDEDDDDLPCDEAD
ncbi:unnamed protein product [Arabis nemorensis]|uniref:Uncharacterized protein n=1 Tax=Arabis nemorensis TaxID=586526 RepID=A0A565C6V0_9BRAS|nr:unnamed protein product [Arabis nemorensis]